MNAETVATAKKARPMPLFLPFKSVKDELPEKGVEVLIVREFEPPDSPVIQIAKFTGDEMFGWPQFSEDDGEDVTYFYGDVMYWAELKGPSLD